MVDSAISSDKSRMRSFSSSERDLTASAIIILQNKASERQRFRIRHGNLFEAHVIDARRVVLFLLPVV
jgi:hypothetical protein